MNALIQARLSMYKAEAHEEGEETIVHCITSLNRGRCALACLLINVVFAFKYRETLSFI